MIEGTGTNTHICVGQMDSESRSSHGEVPRASDDTWFYFRIDILRRVLESNDFVNNPFNVKNK